MAEKPSTGWLDWYLVTGFFATVGVAMWRGIPEGSSHDIVLMLMTAVVTYTGAVVQFRYGTTVGSEKKSEQITQLATTAATAAGTAAAQQAASVVVPSSMPDPTKVEVVGDVQITPSSGEGDKTP